MPLYRQHWLLFMSVHATQFQLHNYIQLNTFPSKYARLNQDLIPTLAGPGVCILYVFITAKVDLLENVFNLCMHGCNYAARIVFE